jgi:hypothetical protein
VDDEDAEDAAERNEPADDDEHGDLQRMRDWRFIGLAMRRLRRSVGAQRVPRSMHQTGLRTANNGPKLAALASPEGSLVPWGGPAAPKKTASEEAA